MLTIEGHSIQSAGLDIHFGCHVPRRKKEPTTFYASVKGQACTYQGSGRPLGCQVLKDVITGYNRAAALIANRTQQPVKHIEWSEI